MRNFEENCRAALGLRSFSPLGSYLAKRRKNRLNSLIFENVTIFQRTSNGKVYICSSHLNFHFMALVKFPEGQQRSGKQGGIVWSRNRFGAYARNRAVPVNPDSAKQRTVRNQFSQNSKAWADLSDAARGQWNTLASNLPRKNRLGDTIFLTGAQQYQSSNQGLASFGVVLDTPLAVTPVPFPTDVIIGAQPNLVLTTIEGDTPANYGIIIEATRCVSNGITSGTVKSQYKKLTNIAPETTLGDTFSLTDVWGAIYGDPVANSVVFIRYQWISFDTGQTSGWEVVKSIIPA